MTITLRLLAASLMVALGACGGGSSSPTTPTTQPTPVPAVNFAGSWSGTYTITACGQTGTFAVGGFCDSFSIGSVWPLRLTLTQSGSSVNGTLSQGSIVTTVTGTVDSAGRLTLNGTGTTSGFSLQIVGWGSSLSGSLMVGTWGTVWTFPGWSGYAQVVNSLGTFTR